MMTNDLLREKYRVQKVLDEKANHNLAQYVANAHARIKEIEAKYGVKFKYGKPTLSFPLRDGVCNPVLINVSNKQNQST